MTVFAVILSKVKTEDVHKPKGRMLLVYEHWEYWPLQQGIQSMSPVSGDKWIMARLMAQSEQSMTIIDASPSSHQIHWWTKASFILFQNGIRWYNMIIFLGGISSFSDTPHIHFWLVKSHEKTWWNLGCWFHPHRGCSLTGTGSRHLLPPGCLGEANEVARYHSSSMTYFPKRNERIDFHRLKIESSQKWYCTSQWM